MSFNNKLNNTTKQPPYFSEEDVITSTNEPLVKHVTHSISPKPTTYPFTIITASSANHLCSLENFLYSLSSLRDQVELDEFPRIVVYNIGMNRTQLPILDQFVETGLVDEMITFDYFKYPRFWDVAISAGEYAWKTGIVHEASKKYAEDGILIWLDAGNIVTPEFLRTIPSVVRENGGFWSPKSSKRMKDWTHPGMYDYFGVDPKSYALNPNCNGAAIGFDISNQTVLENVIEPWYQCGLDKNCIAPPGSSRANHRQDQAALTFLAYRAGYSCRKAPNSYSLQTHRDHSCRSELMALDIQNKLNHPSSIDYPKWYASNTLQLYHHPEWRYPEDQIPERLSRMLNPPEQQQYVA
ncbi:hypothetical protein G6F55_005424 [Rhizopus delemar]|uniref:Uncharacterized protein n=1 Tax=Rhizopus delemar TaxID=936053 RepID=A0A9P6Z2X6_9FUNG|nr:hypothetical protein G6F55_005424 [Rhizopus delemar]KAG1569355.1 hypothetical protein G6F50_006453 [Rhizopus delemar]KAG1634304.1 hypothetical protein G6F45_002826 [Rhizopus arrhizus]